VTLKRQLKQNQQNPLLLSNFGVDDNDNDDIIVDDDVTFGRNRQAKKFGKIIHEDIKLSPYIKIRLALARMKAMEAYRKAQA
jgi:hypothetical protein